MTLTRRTALKLGLAGTLSVAALPRAFAQVRITVTGSDFTPFPIAIPDFASSDPQFGREVAEIIRNNLRRSGLFAVTDPAALPVPVGDVGMQPDFNQWRAIAVNAVVMASVERGGQASVRVWDTQTGQQVVGQSYSADPNSWRRVGHIVSDAIYTSLTGESPYFDSRVVYVAESGPKANRTKRLAIMDQDGANMQYLTSGQTAALTPRFSPDRTTLTYMNFETGANPQVYLLNLATGEQQRLGSFGQMTFSPRFSPDGRTVVFSVEQGGTTNLWALPLGGQPVQLTNGTAIDTAASYSPDGSRIVFESDRGGSQQVYIMGAGGGAAQRVSYGEGSYSTQVWSPKGDLIAFTKQSAGQFHIGIMRPDGSEERILASSFHNEGPSWAPNGRVIMFFRDPGGNDGPSLYSVDVWGRNEQRLPTETYASDPAWSPLLA